MVICVFKIEFERGLKEWYPKEYKGVIMELLQSASTVIRGRNKKERGEWWTTVTVSRRKLEKAFKALVYKYIEEDEMAVAVLGKIYYDVVDCMENRDECTLYVE